MKHIIKTHEPPELRQWFEGHPVVDGRRINCRYGDAGDMDPATKALVRAALLIDQGGLCCYTGIRVTETTSHIEHFKPQSLSRRLGDHDDVSYVNMFLAYPQNTPGAKKCPFGAEARGHWYDPDLFVNPLDVQCEQRFTYTYSGEMQSAVIDDEAAKTTITKLNLNDGKLRELRSARIDAMLFGDRDGGLTIDDLETIRSAMEQRDDQGMFLEFCFVIQYICADLLRRVGN